MCKCKHYLKQNEYLELLLEINMRSRSKRERNRGTSGNNRKLAGQLTKPVRVF